MKRKSKSIDIALLSLIEKDKKQAFGVIYDTFSEEVFAYILSKIGDKEISKDILHDTFVGFWNNIESIESSIIGYLKTTAKFNVLKYFRSRKVENKYLEYLQFFLKDYYRADFEIYSKELHERLLQVLSELPERSKDSFLLSRFEGKTNEEIAEKLGISKGTVENYISLAVKKIRQDFLENLNN